MNIHKYFMFAGVLILFLYSCSTGKKALQKGDYFSAVVKAADRLKSDPDNKKATKVLRDGYNLAMEWSQEEMDLALSSNSRFKWEKVINLMQQANRLADEIRSTPAARKIVTSQKSYSSELNLALEKAAEERYLTGKKELEINTREAAKTAFKHFSIANNFVPDYKDTGDLMDIAKEIATVHVVLETIPITTQKYRLSAEFFYDQVYEYLNNQYGENSFVIFYSPSQAEQAGLEHPDLIVNMEFFDFSVGNLTHTEKEEELKKRVRIESKDTTRIQYKNYVAKLKTFSDQVNSGGRLRVQVSEYVTDKLLFDELIPGSFNWVNEYAIFVGDKEAMDKKQLELTKRKNLPLPPEQDLFIEFTKPIYSQLTSKLNQFFRSYD